MDRHSIAGFGALRRALWLHRSPSRPVAALQCRFEALLGETSAAARALVYDWFFYKQLERRSWAGTAGHRGSVLLDAQRVGQYLNQCTRGVVIATIHMGDYLEGLRQLRLAASVDRPVFVIRRREQSDAEQRLFERIGAATSLTVLRRGPRSVATAIRELRRGAIVIVLYDLPARYGRTVAVRFFDRAANFVRGPAELAVVGRADVLPLFCHYDDDGATVAQAMPVFSANAGDDRSARVAIVTQRLCTLAEAQIRRYPSQWAHWSLVDELIGDAGLTSLQRRS